MDGSLKARLLEAVDLALRGDWQAAHLIAQDHEAPTSSGAGSDVPVTPISPWWGIWAGVARKDPERGEVIAPEKRLPVRDVLRMYTRNGAWLGFEEGRVGVLAPGAFADLIVVDRNVLAVPTDELKDVKVLQTIVAGQVVSEP